MVGDLLHRYIDPSDSLAELLFGAIMALTFTLGARLLAPEEMHPHALVIGIVGCNVAWGIIDAVLYLIGSVYRRNLRVQFVHRLQATATEAEAMAAIREEFGLENEPQMTRQDRAAFHRVVLEILRHARTERARLRLQDFQAAGLIAVLVAITALPGILPFLFLSNATLAVRLANTIQIALLFLVGFSWARHSGANPWRTGGLIVLLSLGMVGVSLALGG